MNLESISLLYRYHVWAYDRILYAAARLTPEQFNQPLDCLGGEPPRSLRAVLIHLLNAEWVWRSRTMLGISPTAALDTSGLTTPAELFAQLREETETMRYYIAGLTSARLQEPVTYTTTGGRSFATPLWQILAHMVLHGMQHRSEAALALTNFDASPGDIDLIRFLRESQ
ncbi:MAG: DinB family protein [Anaerolineales bacterium]|jgi:uncharacterized damage-inducible protein DinB